IDPKYLFRGCVLPVMADTKIYKTNPNIPLFSINHKSQFQSLRMLPRLSSMLDCPGPFDRRNRESRTLPLYGSPRGVPGGFATGLDHINLTESMSYRS